MILHKVSMGPSLSLTKTGFLLNLDGVVYTMTKIGTILKVTGEGTCFYIAETLHGIEKIHCSLSALSILLAKL